MDFFISTKYRTDKEELMDDFSIGGDLLRDTLDKLENINRWLGGNKVTIHGLKTILKNHFKSIIKMIIGVCEIMVAILFSDLYNCIST